MWKNTVERGRPQMTVWRMRTTCWISKATHPHKMQYLLFSTAVMVTRTLLNATSYVQCLSCGLMYPLKIIVGRTIRNAVK